MVIPPVRVCSAEWSGSLTFQFLARVMMEVVPVFNPGTGSSQRPEVQNADIPVPRARDNRGNPRGFHHGQGSSAFRGAERHDHGLVPGQGSTAPRGDHRHDDVDSEDEFTEVRHDDWVSTVDDHQNQYYWDRRHNTTHWSMLPGHAPLVGPSITEDISGGRDADGGSGSSRGSTAVDGPLAGVRV